MIVDTSAIIAIVLQESHADACMNAILDAEQAYVSAASLLEAFIVLDRHQSDVVSRELDVLTTSLGLAIVPFSAEQCDIARSAHRRFGRRSGSKAQLNYGDCFAYALAIDMGSPLLFIGEDFTHTDVTPAIAS